MIPNLSYNIPLALKPFVSGVCFLQKYNFGNELRPMRYFADGRPGIMYIESDFDILLNQEKKLSSLFLYGQTVKPIEILAKGSYRTIILYLKPTGIKSLFGIEASQLRDDCLDFTLLPKVGAREIKERLLETATLEEKTEIIYAFLIDIVQRCSMKQDSKINFATQQLMRGGGSIPLQTVQSKLGIAERTFERKFKEYVGITPRLFARICKFQTVLGQMQSADYFKLSDLAYDNDFSDQSHFIRTFKEFTGITPSEYVATLNHSRD